MKERLRSEQRRFVEMLDTLSEETPLYFLDETSLHTWYVRTKTWQSVEKSVVLPK